MGMTIEDIIQSLTNMKSVIGVNQLTINEAIETMRKYQKIEEIVENYGFDTSWLCLKKIGEVIDDGA